MKIKLIKLHDLLKNKQFTKKNQNENKTNYTTIKTKN